MSMAGQQPAFSSLRAVTTFLRRMGERLSPPPTTPIQVLSDLHLEVGDQYSTYTFPATAPYLLLAGDTGRLIDYEGYLRFLSAQTARYERVFLVLGNHEFYGQDYESGIAQAQRLCGEASLGSRVILLHRTRWDDPQSALTILGCTLWSRIPDDAVRAVEGTVKDFKHIQQWDAQKHNRVHSQEVSWLEEQVAQARSSQRRMVVVTHHAPCVKGTSRPEQERNPWTSAFATDLLGGGGWEGVGTWVFGHTHYSTSFVREGIRVVANQRGYVLPGRKSETVRLDGRDDGRKVSVFDEGMVVNV